MYLEMAAEEDKKMAEGWKADADRILITIFVRHSLSSGAMRLSPTGMDWSIFCCSQSQR